MSVRVCKSKHGFLEVDLRVRLADGTQHRERVKSPVPSRSGARRWGEERALYLAVHGPAAKVEAPRLREFATRWITEYAKANQLKPSTIDTYENIRLPHILPVLGDLRLDEVDAAAIQRLKVAMAELNPTTVNGVLNLLSGMLRTAVEWGELRAMPPRIGKLKVDKAAPFEFYGFEDFERLVDGAAKCGGDHLAMVLLGGEAGLRRGELLALEQTDVNHQAGQLTIQRSEWEGEVTVPKGGRTRRVPMTARLSAAMQAVRHLRGPRVFYQPDGKTVDAYVVRCWMQQAQTRAGLPLTCGVHLLRHTFCSHLAMKGAPARSIMELAGHSDLSTTLRYMHLSPASPDQAIRLLEGRGGEIGERAAASNWKGE